jgi:hypothetical protein
MLEKVFSSASSAARFHRSSEERCDGGSVWQAEARGGKKPRNWEWALNHP